MHTDPGPVTDLIGSHKSQIPELGLYVNPALQVDVTHAIFMASNTFPALQTQPFSRATPVESVTSEHFKHISLLTIQT